jgi:hypothetical protein
VGEIRYIAAGMLETGKPMSTAKPKCAKLSFPGASCMEWREYCGERRLIGIIFHEKQADMLIDKARIWRELKQLAKAAGVPGDKRTSMSIPSTRVLGGP